MSAPTPRLSIGLIVHDGENYLRQAVDSLLAQTFSDFELILSDNGSTDATPAICQEYVRRDRRVHHARSEVNHGAAWNHNRVLELARGDLFKLAAHDDVCHPEFLARCVSALDAHPEAVLAHTRMRVLRRISHGWSIADYPYRMDLGSDRPSTRFGAVIRSELPSSPIFGVARTACARRVPPFGDNDAADRVWLARLVLLGGVCEVAEHLFDYRYHPAQATRHYLAGELDAFYGWWNPARRGSRVYPAWRFLRELVVSAAWAPLSALERARCLRQAAGWAWWRRRWLGEEAARLVGFARTAPAATRVDEPRT